MSMCSTNNLREEEVFCILVCMHCGAIDFID